MITITEECDGCGRTENIAVDAVLNGVDLELLATADGWAEVGDDKHLCPRCIKRALDDSPKHNKLTILRP